MKEDLSGWMQVGLALAAFDIALLLFGQGSLTAETSAAVMPLLIWSLYISATAVLTLICVAFFRTLEWLGPFFSGLFKKESRSDAVADAMSILGDLLVHSLAAVLLLTSMVLLFIAVYHMTRGLLFGT